MLRRILATIGALVIPAALFFLTQGMGDFRLPWQNRPDISLGGPVIPQARGKLAYIRGGDVWAFDLGGGTGRRLTRTGGASSPQWSGTGGWISFQRQGKLWVIKGDGSGLAAVPGADLPATARWAPFGLRLAYLSSDGSLSIFEPGGSADAIRRVLVPPGSGAGGHLAWSSDTTRIAYERHQTIGPGLNNEAIWSIAVTGREHRALYAASGDFLVSLCCWTAGEAYLLFWQGNSASAATTEGLPLYFIRSDGAQPVPTQRSALRYPALIDSAPRANAVAVATGGAREATASKALVAMEPEPVPGNRVVIRSLVYEESPALAPLHPAWAPQSTALAYSVGPSILSTNGDLAASLASRRIFLVQPDGAQKRPLMPEATIPKEVSDDRPMWSRDGSSLVFARRLTPEAAARRPAGQPLPDGVELWVASSDGSVARRAVSGIADPGAGVNGYVDWSEQFDYYRG